MSNTSANRHAALDDLLNSTEPMSNAAHHLYTNNLTVNAANPATYFFGKTMTYADLDAQVRAAAASLKAFGIRPVTIAT